MLFVFIYDLGIYGLWLGPVCGVSVELFLYIAVYVFGIKWEETLN